MASLPPISSSGSLPAPELRKQLPQFEEHVNILASLVFKGIASSGPEPLKPFYEHTLSTLKGLREKADWEGKKNAFNENLTQGNYGLCAANLSDLLTDIQMTTMQFPETDKTAQSIGHSVARLRALQEKIQKHLPASLEHSFDLLKPLVLNPIKEPMEGEPESTVKKRKRPKKPRTSEEERKTSETPTDPLKLFLDKGKNPLPIENWDKWLNSFQDEINKGNYDLCNQELKNLVLVLDNYLLYAEYQLGVEFASNPLNPQENADLTGRLLKMRTLLDGLTCLTHYDSIASIINGEQLKNLLEFGAIPGTSTETLTQFIDAATKSCLAPLEGWESWCNTLQTNLANGQYAACTEMIKGYAKELNDFLSSGITGFSQIPDVDQKNKENIQQLKNKLSSLVQQSKDEGYVRRFGPAVSLGLSATCFAAAGAVAAVSVVPSPLSPVGWWVTASLAAAGCNEVIAARQYETSPTFAIAQTIGAPALTFAPYAGPPLSMGATSLSAYKEGIASAAKRNISFAVGTHIKRKKEASPHRQPVKCTSFTRRHSITESRQQGKKTVVARQRGITGTIKAGMAAVAPSAFAAPPSPVDVTPEKVLFSGFGDTSFIEPAPPAQDPTPMDQDKNEL